MVTIIQTYLAGLLWRLNILLIKYFVQRLLCRRPSQIVPIHSPSPELGHQHRQAEKVTDDGLHRPGAESMAAGKASVLPLLQPKLAVHNGKCERRYSRI